MRIGRTFLHVAFVLGLSACSGEQETKEGFVKAVVYAGDRLRISVTVSPSNVTKNLSYVPVDGGFFSGALRVPAGECTVTATAYSDEARIASASFFRYIVACVSVRSLNTAPASTEMPASWAISRSSSKLRRFSSALGSDGKSFIALSTSNSSTGTVYPCLRRRRA